MLDCWSVMVKTKRLHEKRVFKWAPDHVQMLREWTRRKNNTLASLQPSRLTIQKRTSYIPFARGRAGQLASSIQQCENCRLVVASVESVPCLVSVFQDATEKLVSLSSLFTSYNARYFLYMECCARRKYE